MECPPEFFKTDKIACRNLHFSRQHNSRCPELYTNFVSIGQDVIVHNYACPHTERKAQTYNWNNKSYVCRKAGDVNILIERNRDFLPSNTILFHVNIRDNIFLLAREYATVDTLSTVILH